MSDTLSPSEMESLLGGLDLSSTGRTHTDARNDSSVPRTASDQFTLPLALAGKEQAALATALEVFTERWQGTWTDAFRHRFSVGNTAVSISRLREFIGAHQGWQTFEVTCPKHTLPIWISIDNEAVAQHVDFLLGVSVEGAAASDFRQWGPIEIQLTTRLVQALCQALSDTFSGDDFVWKTTPLRSASEWVSGTQLFLLSDLVQFELEIHCCQSRGRINIGIPRVLTQTWCSNRAPLNRDRDLTYSASSQESVELQAVLPPVQISRGEFQRLEIGDVILVGARSETVCEIKLEGETRFTATVGSHEGAKAVQLMAVAAPLPE